MCCKPIALPADFNGIDMVALAKMVTQPCEHCGRKHNGVGLAVDGGRVFCQHCHKQVLAGKRPRRTRYVSATRRRSVVRVTPMPMTPRAPRPR